MRPPASPIRLISTSGPVWAPVVVPRAGRGTHERFIDQRIATGDAARSDTDPMRPRMRVLRRDVRGAGSRCGASCRRSGSLLAAPFNAGAVPSPTALPLNLGRWLARPGPHSRDAPAAVAPATRWPHHIETEVAM